MANGKIQIIFNDKDLQQRLKKTIDGFEKKKKKAILRKGAVIVAKQLQADTPTDSGALKASVKAMTWARSPDYFASFAKKPVRYNRKKKIDSDPYYAAFLNEGWTHTWFGRPRGAQKKGTKGAMTSYIGKHKNFIQDATNKAASRVQEKIEEEVKKIINNP